MYTAEPKMTTAALNLHVRNILERLRKSSFVRNVLVVMSGSAMAQAIGFALTPLISRLFTPSDFGIFGSFNSVATIIAAGATLQYSQAIMLPKEKDDAINLFIISCLSTSIIGFLCLICCLVAPASMNGLMNTNGIWALALLVAATVIGGINQSCQAWSVRVKAFKHTSASQVIRSVSSNGMQVGFGYLKAGFVGLIASGVLADLLASINLFRVLLPDVSALRQNIKWARIRQLAKDYKDFPMYSASQNVINALSSGLPVLLLVHFYGIVVAGAYAFGIRIIQAPMSLLLAPLRQVLFQKAGEVQHQGGKLTPLYVKSTAGLFSLVIVPSLIFFILAPQIFSFIFGSQWLIAGNFAQSLILWMLFYFCNLPAVLFARLIRIQRMVFFYDLVLLASRTLTLVLGGLFLSAWQSIMLFSLVGALMNLFLILLVGYAVMRKEGVADWKHFRDSFI